MDLGISGFENAEQVGAGGAGVVDRARQPEFAGDVAIASRSRSTRRLADFGITHLGENAFRTSTDTSSGTVSFLAPEVFLGGEGTEAAEEHSLRAPCLFE